MRGGFWIFAGERPFGLVVILACGRTLLIVFYASSIRKRLTIEQIYQAHQSALSSSDAAGPSVSVPPPKPATVSDVKQTLQTILMQTNTNYSITSSFIRDCSLHERIMLAAIVKCVKREGVEEIKWGEVSRLPSSSSSTSSPTLSFYCMLL